MQDPRPQMKASESPRGVARAQSGQRCRTAQHRGTNAAGSHAAAGAAALRSRV